MNKSKRENANEKQYMELVLSIVQSSYWRNQGKGFFGKTKTPDSILEIRTKLLTDPDFTMQKLQQYVDKIKPSLLNTRSDNTKAFHDILQSKEDLNVKIGKLENLKRSIDKIVGDDLKENHIPRLGD